MEQVTLNIAVDELFPVEKNEAEVVRLMWEFLEYIKLNEQLPRLSGYITADDIKNYESLLRANAQRPNDSVASINTTRRSQTTFNIGDNKELSASVEKISLFLQDFKKELTTLLSLFKGHYYTEIIALLGEWVEFDQITTILKDKFEFEPVTTDGIDGDSNNHAKLIYQSSKSPRWKMIVDKTARQEPLEILHEMVACDVFETIMVENKQRIMSIFNIKTPYQQARDIYDKTHRFIIILSDFLLDRMAEEIAMN